MKNKNKKPLQVLIFIILTVTFLSSIATAIQDPTLALRLILWTVTILILYLVAKALWSLSGTILSMLSQDTGTKEENKGT